MTGANASAVQPLVITLGGSSSAVTTSGNVVTDSVTQRTLGVNLFGLADLQVAPTTACRRARPQQRHGDAELQRRRRVVLDDGSLPSFVTITQIDTW